ncbi:plastocyanin/azurin family copper-binding protein [Haladaptatus sp. DJG-WS-42]|uniref:cupredoxin domain-containing protein n=1 Tax=Haladaptatus sp. DJG-WS-42 TaxID=3120516 RepID=UPI0030D1448A
MDRRTLLKHGVTVSTLGLLAGCTGGGGEETTTTATPTESTTTETTTTAEPTTEQTTTTSETTTTATTTTAEQTPVQSAITITVGQDGNLRFSPTRASVKVGGEVTWTWDSSGHNVRPRSQPDGADWEGTPGGDGTTYSSGDEFTFTFAVPGTYEYYCAPHQSFGMEGILEVVE